MSRGGVGESAGWETCAARARTRIPAASMGSPSCGAVEGEEVGGEEVGGEEVGGEEVGGEEGEGEEGGERRRA